MAEKENGHCKPSDFAIIKDQIHIDEDYHQLRSPNWNQFRQKVAFSGKRLETVQVGMNGHSTRNTFMPPASEHVVKKVLADSNYPEDGNIAKIIALILSYSQSS